MQLVGGTAYHPKLTKKLLTDDPQEYAMGKAVFWHGLLVDGHKPNRWYNPTAKGTRVEFTQIQSAIEASAALGEFRGYVDGINAAYGCDMTVGLALADV